MTELDEIKKKCEKAWINRESVTLTWDEAAAVVDNIQILGDIMAEMEGSKDASNQRTN